MDLQKFRLVKNMKWRVMVYALVFFVVVALVISPPAESSVVTDGDVRIVYYSVDVTPQVPDPTIPPVSLEKAIAVWKKANSDLLFVQSDMANNYIKWNRHTSEEHSGLTTCDSATYQHRIDCVLDITLGMDCGGNYNQFSEKAVTLIIAHEIGHVLGLNHTGDEGHLMGGRSNVQDDFDTNGYVIPDDFRGWLIDLEKIHQQVQEINDTIYDLQAKQEATGVSDQLIQLIDERYRLIDQTDGFTDKFACNSNTVS